MAGHMEQPMDTEDSDVTSVIDDSDKDSTFDPKKHQGEQSSDSDVLLPLEENPDAVEADNSASSRASKKRTARKKEATDGQETQRRPFWSETELYVLMTQVMLKEHRKILRQHQSKNNVDDKDRIFDLIRSKVDSCSSAPGGRYDWEVRNQFKDFPSRTRRKNKRLIQMYLHKDLRIPRADKLTDSELLALTYIKEPYIAGYTRGVIPPEYLRSSNKLPSFPNKRKEKTAERAKRGKSKAKIPAPPSPPPVDSGAHVPISSAELSDDEHPRMPSMPDLSPFKAPLPDSPVFKSNKRSNPAAKGTGQPFAVKRRSRARTPPPATAHSTYTLDSSAVESHSGGEPLPVQSQRRPRTPPTPTTIFTPSHHSTPITTNVSILRKATDTESERQLMTSTFGPFPHVGIPRWPSAAAGSAAGSACSASLNISGMSGMLPYMLPYMAGVAPHGFFQVSAVRTQEGHDSNQLMGEASTENVHGSSTVNKLQSHDMDQASAGLKAIHLPEKSSMVDPAVTSLSQQVGQSAEEHETAHLAEKLPEEIPESQEADQPGEADKETQHTEEFPEASPTLFPLSPEVQPGDAQEQTKSTEKLPVVYPTPNSKGLEVDETAVTQQKKMPAQVVPAVHDKDSELQTQEQKAVEGQEIIKPTEKGTAVHTTVNETHSKDADQQEVLVCEQHPPQKVVDDPKESLPVSDRADNVSTLKDKKKLAAGKPSTQDQPHPGTSAEAGTNSAAEEETPVDNEKREEIGNCLMQYVKYVARTQRMIVKHLMTHPCGFTCPKCKYTPVPENEVEESSSSDSIEEPVPDRARSMQKRRAQERTHATSTSESEVSPPGPSGKAQAKKGKARKKQVPLKKSVSPKKPVPQKKTRPTKNNPEEKEGSLSRKHNRLRV